MTIDSQSEHTIFVVVNQEDYSLGEIRIGEIAACDQNRRGAELLDIFRLCDQ